MLWHSFFISTHQDLGEEGTVLMVQRSGDVKVLINGHPWTVHPACLTMIEADEERSPTEWEEAQLSKIIKDNLKATVTQYPEIASSQS